MSSMDGASGSNEYQVFLSFRGPDTRHGFTDCLYESLVDASIRDTEELRIGKQIGRELLQAIDNSALHMTIFSRNYTSSHWCLRELAKIVESTSNSDGKKEILPVFFDVKPQDVKLKTSLYRGAILEFEQRFPEEVKIWRKALAEVDEIKGWNLRNYQGNRL